MAEQINEGAFGEPEAKRTDTDRANRQFERHLLSVRNRRGYLKDGPGTLIATIIYDEQAGTVTFQRPEQADPEEPPHDVDRLTP